MKRTKYMRRKHTSVIDGPKPASNMYKSYAISMDYQKKKMIRNLGDASTRRTVIAQNPSAAHIHEHDNSSVIRQKGESQNGCYKKTKSAKCSKKQTFLTP